MSGNPQLNMNTDCVDNADHTAKESGKVECQTDH